MILAAKSAACWCFLAALWYFKVAEIVLNPLVGMGKMYCKLGDLKECDGTHSEYCARTIPIVRK